MTITLDRPVLRQATAGRPDTTTAIEVDGVSMRYGEKLALDEVSFTIQRGEKVALLGPNGAGKSTLIEVLAGFRAPSEGSVRVLGRNPLTSTQGANGGVGLMLQNWHDHGKWQVNEFLTQIAAGVGKGRADAQEWAEKVGVGEQWRRQLRHLSGGQRRKVDLAAALLGDPGVLILDEPTTGFDVESRREFQRLVLDVASSTAVLWATHDLVEAEQVCDRIVMLVAGNIRVDSTPAALRRRYSQEVSVSWTESGVRCERKLTEGVNELVRSILDRPGTDGLEVRRKSLEDMYLEIVEGEGNE